MNLAERMRPKTLNEFVGQSKILGENGMLRKMIENKNISSMIFWGPPGCGKTTLALIIANSLNRQLFHLSAINVGVKEIKEIIEKIKKEPMLFPEPPIVFLDEIHRFAKNQQDSLLHAVEKGIFILIGATTENPSFEIINPLLSRCHIFILEPLEYNELKFLLDKAIKEDIILKKKYIEIKEYEALITYSGGDARKMYNILELIVNATSSNKVIIDNSTVENFLNKNILKYDKKGEYHYDIISAFIKSVRGSDPNAALYYLARMLDAGEDIEFIARRLVILAAEDIGLANPNALLIANAAFDAIHKIGMPEAKIILSEATIYLASSPKSNSAYVAIEKAIEAVHTYGDLPVPLHLRNAPTKLLKEIGYHKGYKYPHDYDNNFVVQEYLPQKIKNLVFYEPQNNPRENEIRKYLKNFWKEKYGY
ncbi:MAG: replication-associated recombination protein A [Bacteroidales bacterium]|nr:replication-associated recombination protein A [Bacteroidales bacterium]